MRILVTGGAGFIGRWLLKALPSDVDVVVIDSLVDQVHGGSSGFPQDVAARAECVRCDVGDVEAWKDAAAGVDVVVHLASLTGTGQSMYQRRRYLENNVLGTFSLCEQLASMRRQPRRIVLASSRAVYGEGAYHGGDRLVFPGPRSSASLSAGRWEPSDASGEPLAAAAVPEFAPIQPVSVYGMTKAWQEQIVVSFAKTHDVDFAILRFQNVYGPLQALGNPYTGILGLFTRQVSNGLEVELFEDGEITRDFIHVLDAARALKEAIDYPRRLETTLNVGTGSAVSLRRLVELIGQSLGVAPSVTLKRRYRLGDIRHATADVSRLRDLLGQWEPRSIEEGLTDYVAWFVSQSTVGMDNGEASLSVLESEGCLLSPQAG